MAPIEVVDPLRVATADSILANGVFNDSTIWFAHGAHVEGARCGLARDQCCRGAKTQREKNERNHPVSC
jgi:hypothetical protein